MKRSIVVWASLILGVLSWEHWNGECRGLLPIRWLSCGLRCTARSRRRTSHEPRRIPISIDARTNGLIRQDLFDRNNPNNLRSDWPSPPAQPGQF